MKKYFKIFHFVSYFFSLFAQQVIFFSKVDCNKFFIFLKKITIKSEKCKRKQHIEFEKVQKP